MAEKLTREEIEIGVAEGKSFAGADLKGIDLSFAMLAGGNFEGATFRYSDLRGANLRSANLKAANLRHVVFKGGNLTNCDFRNADLTQADLRGCNVNGIQLGNAKLDGTKGVSSKVFFTQEILDSLHSEDKVKIEGEILTILTGAKPSFKIMPAWRVIKVESGPDNLDLLGKVKTEEDAIEMGVEVFQDSAIHDETVYKLETGFVGHPLTKEELEEYQDEQAETAAAKAAAVPAPAPAPQPVAPTPPPAAAPAPAPAPAAAAPVEEEITESVPDEELLTEFLLKHM